MKSETPRGVQDYEPTLDDAGALAERHARLAYLHGWDEACRRFWQALAEGAPPGLAWQRCHRYRAALWRWATGDTGRLEDPPPWTGG